ncbi:hypothetical protein MFUL124B02_39085 [Myxococcus fulvus 124B02]|nr:hypothetical protein MFUL124B02_39085 [Myxococcus fulvus 124B02]
MTKVDVESLKERMAAFTQSLQDEICQALETLDGSARFREDPWQRPGGGGGRTRVLEDGAVLEKAGVNTSVVFGELEDQFAKKLQGEGRSFWAGGISLVLHPRNPHVPTVHANYRFIHQGGKAWFRGARVHLRALDDGVRRQLRRHAEHLRAGRLRAVQGRDEPPVVGRVIRHEETTFSSAFFAASMRASCAAPPRAPPASCA